MRPLPLSSSLVVLDEAVAGDADRVFEYCQDPVFERYLTNPWPYRSEHAEEFLGEYVPAGWVSDREYTWAVRELSAAELVGVIGLRLTGESVAADASVHSVGSIGFWLGATHRGRGLIPEAQRRDADWAFAEGIIDVPHGEGRVGNVASARAA
ncbi:GNAT family N-acetyltransferase [Cryobacterium ruanii]|uniref:N-acetyltransferase n=1 Tax=Cryobacterium ruanii TaxID=1259197 RepID=A0A4R9AMA5_9MICO|nr:GNAT family N-acetyltransferase [Cryobacterium ruanii]TFD65638.1 N-acetyltransferase [Cryobacterium ruanii]